MNRPATKRDHVVEQLRELIASGEFPRGTRIPQDALAARFEMSITPVREALRQLEAEGLIVCEPHRGVRVASMDILQVKADYVVRRLVEPYAMARACRRVSRKDLDQAREILCDMTSAFESGSLGDVDNLNRQFHFFFYARSGIPELTFHIENLWLGFPWDVLKVIPGRVESSLGEHEDMLKAMEAGDIEEVQNRTGSHLQESYLALARHLNYSSLNDPFDLDEG
jgi:DNA-binding GntR family transcriptional regulator